MVTRTGGADPRQIDAKTSALMRRQSHGMEYKLMLIPAVKLMFNPALKLCLVDVLKASYVIVHLRRCNSTVLTGIEVEKQIES